MTTSSLTPPLQPSQPSVASATGEGTLTGSNPTHQPPNHLIKLETGRTKQPAHCAHHHRPFPSLAFSCAMLHVKRCPSLRDVMCGTGRRQLSFYPRTGSGGPEQDWTNRRTGSSKRWDADASLGNGKKSRPGLAREHSEKVLACFWKLFPTRGIGTEWGPERAGARHTSWVHTGQHSIVS